MVPTYTGYSLYAELKVGANGTNEGVSEFAVGSAQGETGFGNTIWDDNVSDGVDSDWVKVKLVADPTGVTWAVGDRSPVRLTATSVFGDSLSMKVRAAVNGGGRQTSWRDLVVSFYGSRDSDLSQPAEELNLSSSSTPEASTFGSAPDATDDRVIDIVPDGMNYQKVMLSASVRIESLAGVIPSPDAMFAQVYVYSSQPAAQEPAPSPVYTMTYVQEEPETEESTVLS